MRLGSTVHLFDQADVLGKTGADMLAQTLAEKCPRIRQVALSNLRP